MRPIAPNSHCSDNLILSSYKAAKTVPQMLKGLFRRETARAGTRE